MARPLIKGTVTSSLSLFFHFHQSPWSLKYWILGRRQKGLDGHIREVRYFISLSTAGLAIWGNSLGFSQVTSLSKETECCCAPVMQLRHMLCYRRWTTYNGIPHPKPTICQEETSQSAWSLDPKSWSLGHGKGRLDAAIEKPNPSWGWWAWYVETGIRTY